MLLCCLVWLFCLRLLQVNNFIYQGVVSNQQVEQMLKEAPKTFVSPSNNFLAEYALFDQYGEIIESNVEGKKRNELAAFLQADAYNIHVSRYTYENGSTIIVRWFYRAEFVNPVLRSMLPPFEYLWLATLGVALVLCLVFNTLWLGRYLGAKLKLFSDVSMKVGAQKLDFTIPHAGILEYDQALDAMEHMRQALYRSLSSQWAAQQEREAEMAALAHDLKTPLTLVGGNAELLLEEELPKSSRKMVQTILASNNRAKQYVACLLEASTGVDEAFECISLPAMFDELCHITMTFAQDKNVSLQTTNSLSGTAYMQKNHLLRALANVVQNAIEHTPSGGSVYLDGIMIDGGGWQITVRDEGNGFSQSALHHATKRLWRDDTARSINGHNGLGLWFAAQVVKTHAGELMLDNCDLGGVVTILFLRDHSNEMLV